MAAAGSSAKTQGSNLGSHPGDNSAQRALTVSYGRLTNAGADDAPSLDNNRTPDGRLEGQIRAEGTGTWKLFSGVLELLKALEETYIGLH